MGINGTSPKVVIITALISAATAIVVAFIGIVPYLDRKDNATQLQPEKCTINGKITSGENDPLQNAEVYLIRASGSERMATTDDKGRFTFQQIPDTSYWVIVRNITSGKASRVLISKDESSGEVEVVRSLLSYERCKDL